MKNKKIFKKHLDEAQTRNNVGNQCFFIIISLLLVILGLRHCGVKWAASSMSITAIVVICMAYYLIRVIWVEKYIPYSKKKSSIVVGLFVIVVIILCLILLISKTNFNTP